MTVGSVVKAVAVLRHLAKSQPQGVNAIARELKISPSSCFSILKTLVEERFLEFEPHSKLYGLSHEPKIIFGAQTEPSDWLQWVKSGLALMSEEFSICCGLWRISEGRATLIEVTESSLATRIHLTAGQRLPAYIGAMGRCVAARERLGPEAISDIINGLRWQSPPTLENYRSEMARSLVEGWAMDEGNYFKGLTTVAAAVTDRHGAVRHCLTSTTFNGQFDRTTLSRIGVRTALFARRAAERLAESSPSGDQPTAAHS